MVPGQCAASAENACPLTTAAGSGSMQHTVDKKNTQKCTNRQWVSSLHRLAVKRRRNQWSPTHSQDLSAMLLQYRMTPLYTNTHALTCRERHIRTPLRKPTCRHTHMHVKTHVHASTHLQRKRGIYSYRHTHRHTHSKKRCGGSQ